MVHCSIGPSLALATFGGVFFGTLRWPRSDSMVSAWLTEHGPVTSLFFSSYQLGWCRWLCSFGIIGRWLTTTTLSSSSSHMLLMVRSQDRILVPAGPHQQAERVQHFRLLQPFLTNFINAYYVQRRLPRLTTPFVMYIYIKFRLVMVMNFYIMLLVGDGHRSHSIRRRWVFLSRITTVADAPRRQFIHLWWQSFCRHLPVEKFSPFSNRNFFAIPAC